MFHVGEKVVYPMHGAGIIESIEDKIIFGSSQKCYVIRLLIGDIKVIIPIEDVSSIDLRHIGDSNKYKEAINILYGPFIKMEEKWNIRYRENERRIKKGNILEIAEVVNYLAGMYKLNKLSTGEKKMFYNAYQILISELSLIKDISIEDMKKTIDEKLNIC